MDESDGRGGDRTGGRSGRTVERLARHEFLAGLGAGDLEALAACARDVHFDAGAVILRQGEHADTFYLLTHGRVAVEAYEPRSGPIAIETLDEHDVLGWSWLVPPYRWHFDARALSLVRAIALDAAGVRQRLEADPRLGYELMKRVTTVIVGRLQHTQIRMLDIYDVAPA